MIVALNFRISYWIDMMMIMPPIIGMRMRSSLERISIENAYILVNIWLEQ